MSSLARFLLVAGSVMAIVGIAESLVHTWCWIRRVRVQAEVDAMCRGFLPERFL